MKWSIRIHWADLLDQNGQHTKMIHVRTALRQNSRLPPEQSWWQGFHAKKNAILEILRFCHGCGYQYEVRSWEVADCCWLILLLIDASTVFRDGFWDCFRREVREANDWRCVALATFSHCFKATRRHRFKELRIQEDGCDTSTSKVSQVSKQAAQSLLVCKALHGFPAEKRSSSEFSLCQLCPLCPLYIALRTDYGWDQAAKGPSSSV